MTPAHQADGLAELVCSNSFRSDDAEHNAVGLLHQEMRALGSLVMRAGDAHRVPAGSALAVDRDGFRRRGDARARRASQHRRRARASRRAPRLRPDDRCHRAPHRARSSPSASPRRPARRARFLRRDRADRPSRQHRHGRLLDGRALGQGRQGLHQLPDDKAQYHAFVAALSTARRPSSTTGRRTRPISRAACRSK